ncbi:hypothetical protein NPIL_255641, partial [Nephila pilipes]
MVTDLRPADIRAIGSCPDTIKSPGLR